MASREQLKGRPARSARLVMFCRQVLIFEGWPDLITKAGRRRGQTLHKAVDEELHAVTAGYE
jgi:predicted ATPase